MNQGKYKNFTGQYPRSTGCISPSERVIITSVVAHNAMQHEGIMTIRFHISVCRS